MESKKFRGEIIMEKNNVRDQGVKINMQPNSCKVIFVN